MSNSEVSKERHNAKVVGYTKCMLCGEVIELYDNVDWEESMKLAVMCLPCRSTLNEHRH